MPGGPFRYRQRVVRRSDRGAITTSSLLSGENDRPPSSPRGAVVDVVRQLVGVAGGVVGEMLGQILADCFDSGDEAPRKITLLKLLRHCADDLMPKVLANFLVDAGVA